MKAARFLLFVPRALTAYRQETGRSLFFWAVIALLSLATQIVFRRNLPPGEFATLNTLLAVIGLAATPTLAMRHALVHFHPRDDTPEKREVIDKAGGVLMQNFALARIFVCALLVLPFLNFLGLPRFSLGWWTMLNVFPAIGAVYTAYLLEKQNRRKAAAALLFFACVIRLLFVWLVIGPEPWADTGLAAGAIAGLIMVAPLFRQGKFVLDRKKAQELLRDREFLIHAIATLCVVIGTFFFINADRIVAQPWFGEPSDNNMGYVRWGVFDGYQTAGLIGRSLLWGTQPILLLLLAQRVGQVRTDRATRRIFWIYLAILVGGIALVYQLAEPLSRLFGGEDQDMTAHFIPAFALIMLPLGLLQGLGVFSLASRRYPECFTFGGASLAYALLLALVGKPQVIQSYMFGGAVVALLLVLFVGVVRWGRAQP